jgi:hypothetical protein
VSELKTKVGILKNEDPFDHYPWIVSCKKRKDILFKIIDFSREDWFENIESFNPDILLTKPAGKTSLFRDQYLERLSMLNEKYSFKSIPSFNEAQLYESKRYLSYWLKYRNIPHPRTWVFYTRKESFDFAKHAKFPIVAKMNIGASGDGVIILYNESELISYITKAFSVGIRSISGPKLSKGKILKRIWNIIQQPKKFCNKLHTYKQISDDKQIGFVIFQEYIKHDFEWRAVRIGDSFFAHKKMKINEKASGSLLKGYENPNLKIFDFVENITSPYNFNSMAIDIFETSSGSFLVNEMQCIFGQSDSYQMLVNGKMGRYRKINNKWIFEEGDFASNQCYDLRLDFMINNMMR